MTTSTYELASPRRPGIADLGGGQKANDVSYPPDPVTQVGADDINQWGFAIAALARVTPVCVLDVHFVAGSPTIASVSAASTGVIAGTFTIVLTATGHVTITWPANTFPPPAADADASITGSTLGQIAVASTTNQVDVYTGNTSGTATNLNFHLRIR